MADVKNSADVSQLHAGAAEALKQAAQLLKEAKEKLLRGDDTEAMELQMQALAKQHEAQKVLGEAMEIR